MKKTLVLGLAGLAISAIALPSKGLANEPTKNPELHRRSMEYLTEFERVHQAAFGRTSAIASTDPTAVERWRTMLNWRIESALTYCKYLRNGGTPESDTMDAVAELIARNRQPTSKDTQTTAKELRQEFLVMMSIAPKHFCPEKAKL
ncbi:hypothetical protein LEP3755_09780 [Leptolyngbya sp. NIES-3755]|nr:hypothetical protein LEP3755_09780 [Leptolyngbya sp. NIES-3755]